MKIKDLKKMLEVEEFELNPPHVNWGPWAGDLDLDSLLEKQNENRTNS